MLVISKQLYPTVWKPIDCSPSGSSVHGILQARILEQVVISFSRGSSQPRNQTQVSCIAGRFFTIWAIREALQKGIFRAMKLYCVILHWGMHVTFVKTHRLHNTKNEPHLNYGPWMMMVYQSWFITFNKCTVLVWALTVGDTAREKHGGYRNPLYVPLSFAVNQKLLSTIKSIGKNKQTNMSSRYSTSTTHANTGPSSRWDSGKVKSSGLYMKHSQYKDRS